MVFTSLNPYFIWKITERRTKIGGLIVPFTNLGPSRLGQAVDTQLDSRLAVVPATFGHLPHLEEERVLYPPPFPIHLPHFDSSLSPFVFPPIRCYFVVRLFSLFSIRETGSNCCVIDLPRQNYSYSYGDHHYLLQLTPSLSLSFNILPFLLIYRLLCPPANGDNKQQPSASCDNLPAQNRFAFFSPPTTT